MAETKYTYSVASDTANGAVDLMSLENEIRSSAILTSHNRNDVSGDVLDIWFNDAISAGDKTTLDGIVAAHQGVTETTIETVTVVESPPFASKTLSDGRSLFSRVHGERFTCVAGSNTFSFSVPYPQVKFNELEIIGAEIGDRASLKVMDDASGTYTTVPNYQLNQFGYSVAIAKDYYDRASNYDADLYYGMVICVEFESESAKDILVNFIMHEIKA